MEKVLVIIDPQNDFIIGSMGDKWKQNVADKIAEHIKAQGNTYSRIYVTQDTHWNIPSEHLTRYGKHCIISTEGWKIYEPINLALKGIETIVMPVLKSTFGAPIDSLESPTDPDTHEFCAEIDVCGFCTDICVISNVLRLLDKFMDQNVKINVIGDLCAGLTLSTHENALEIMENMGAKII